MEECPEYLISYWASADLHTSGVTRQLTVLKHVKYTRFLYKLCKWIDKLHDLTTNDYIVHLNRRIRSILILLSLQCCIILQNCVVYSVFVSLGRYFIMIRFIVIKFIMLKCPLYAIIVQICNTLKVLGGMFCFLFRPCEWRIWNYYIWVTLSDIFSR